MNLLELLSSKEDRGEACSRIYGVAIGVVTNNQDPDSSGRVKVKFPWLVENDESTWAWVASPMAGPDRGLIFIPEVDDEVLVAFDHGDVRAPYIIGALWNGSDKLPREKAGDDKNNLRIIKSRSNHLIILDDTAGSEKIQIIDAKGKNQIIIDSNKDTITLQVAGDLVLKATNGKIMLDAKSVEMKSSADMKVTSGSTMDITASSTLNVKGKTVNIN
jgi:uncharacterized protein involved in type VI secretion and phage assembly